MTTQAKKFPVLLALLIASASLYAQNELPAVIVTGSSSIGDQASSIPISDSPMAVGAVTVIHLTDLHQFVGVTLDDVVQRAGVASVDAGGSFGITNGASVRGFAVQKLGGVSSSKTLINGHPDVADSFNRDMSTVEKIELIGGFDATLVGAGNPGGMIALETKRPRGTQSHQLQTEIGSDGLKRMVIDAEKDFDRLQLRLILASQRGQQTLEGVGTSRDNFFLTSKLATQVGLFRLETEYAKNKAPFVFGTFYANKQFQYDIPYVSPQSTAKRDTKRAALYWETELGDSMFAQAWLQQAVVRRIESLLGFYSPIDDVLADGYYRPIDSTYHQRDVGLLLKKTSSLWGLTHAFTASASRQTQDFHFNGPESVGDFTISIATPVWPVDVHALPLVPYTYQGKKTESGIGLVDSVEITDRLQFRLGVRQSRVDIRSSEDATAPDKTAHLSHWTHSEGLSYQSSPQNKWWISRSSSFMPALGQTKEGNLLDPVTATQVEIGCLRKTAAYTGSVSLFEIQQVNLPGADPSNRNYLIPLGNISSKGVSVSGQLDAMGLTWKANATYQAVRNTKPVRTSQGPYVAGVPQLLGALTVSTPESKKQGVGAWLTASGTGKRAADSHASLFAKGYLRWDAGLSYAQASWRFNAQVQNLFDLRYIQSLNASDNAWQGERRQLQLSATYTF